MQRIWRREIAAALFGSIAMLFVVAPAMGDCSKSLTWAWNQYEPYSYKNSSRILVGLDVELVHEILGAAKCPYKSIEVPAKRALKMLETGEIDMVAAASVTPEREAFGYFTEPYRNERIVMFALRDSPAIGLNSLAEVLARRLRITASLGGYYGKDYAIYQPQFQHQGLLELNNSLEQRVTMLALGRVDVMIEDQVAGIETARKLRYDDRIVTVGQPLNDEPVHLLLSKASVTPDTVAAIDAVIRNLPTSLEYQRIMKAHTEFGYK